MIRLPVFDSNFAKKHFRDANYRQPGPYNILVGPPFDSLRLVNKLDVNRLEAVMPQAPAAAANASAVSSTCSVLQLLGKPGLRVF